MVNKKIFFLFLIILLPLAGCIERRTQATFDKETSVSRELAAMVEEDQRIRYNDSLEWSVVAAIDLKHRQRIFELLVKGEITEPKNLYHAALILQHAEPSSCQECYYLAYLLAYEAVARGYEEARNLTATCLDRYLVFSGLPQKYGTQFNRDSTGHWYLFEIDSLTTDSERQVWDVKPLEVIKAQIEKMNRNIP